jgi:uncharacterized ubiquitin-like protein YukD
MRIWIQEQFELTKQNHSTVTYPIKSIHSCNWDSSVIIISEKEKMKIKVRNKLSRNKDTTNERQK